MLQGGKGYRENGFPWYGIDDPAQRSSVGFGDDFECVALIYEELLAFTRVEHLLGVAGDQRVEKRIE